MSEPVLLISMPFGPINTPSIGLSLLKAGLARESIKARILYFNLAFARLIGAESYERVIQEVPNTDLAGDWIFSDYLFGLKSKDEIECFVDGVLRRRGIDPSRETALLEPVSEALINKILEIRSLAERFVTDCLNEVIAAQPRVVGFTSVFQQQIASLALAKRIKETLPRATIVFGGGNCEGVMGRELFNRFGFLDIVVSGEGDLVFPEIARRLLLDLPVHSSPGVYSRSSAGLQLFDCSATSTPTVEKLDALPTPDYEDYFAQFTSHLSEDDLSPSILFETSRGCWWGAKHHCTFCGLNGVTMRYRSKTPRRALAELVTLAEKYPDRDIGVVDNILDMKYFKSFIPYLTKRQLGLSLAYEVKANLTKKQLIMLEAAGITTLQPGIESFSDRVLSIMRKGVRAIQNIQFLKWCQELDIYPSWNLLWGFPDEPADDYKEMTAIVPLITHLPPPYSVAKIRTDRFSPNHDRAEELGFKGVHPYPAYSFVYNLPAESIANLAYFFTYEYAKPQQCEDYVGPLVESVCQWMDQHCRSKLFSIEKDGRLLVFDSRPVARESIAVLEGLAKLCYQACDESRTLKSLQRELQRLTNTRLELQEIESCLDDMIGRKLMLRHGSSYLALAVPRSLGHHPETN
jgi:ribosomal peptide maturation radical SAM protein 1